MYIYAHIYIHKMNGNTYDITVGRVTALPLRALLLTLKLNDECSLFKNLEIPAGSNLLRTVAAYSFCLSKFSWANKRITLSDKLYIFLSAVSEVS